MLTTYSMYFTNPHQTITPACRVLKTLILGRVTWLAAGPRAGRWWAQTSMPGLWAPGAKPFHGGLHSTFTSCLQPRSVMQPLMRNTGSSDLSQARSSSQGKYHFLEGQSLTSLWKILGVGFPVSIRGHKIPWGTWVFSLAYHLLRMTGESCCVVWLRENNPALRRGRLWV